MSAIASEVPAMVGIGEAARLLGVSAALLRKREDEGKVAPAARDAAGRRLYSIADINRWAAAGDLAKRRPGRRPARVLLPERVALSYEDQQECLNIARAITVQLCHRIDGLDFDEAFSDACYGVAVALSRPTADCPWNVACYVQARWRVLTGFVKRSGISSADFKQGVRWSDLPVEQQPPKSLDAMLADSAEPFPLALDNVHRATTRLVLESIIERLSERERIVLVNSVVHQFTDDEIAAEMGLSRSGVGAIRRRAIGQLQSARPGGTSELVWTGVA